MHHPAHDGVAVAARKTGISLPRTWGARAKTVTVDDARRIGAEIGIDWDTAPFDPKEFQAGMEVELERGSHDPQTDVTGDDPHLTAKIAWAHLKEFADYYVRLARMETEAEAARGRGCASLVLSTSPSTALHSRG